MNRRTFLRRTTLTTATLAGAPFIRGAETRKLRTALIGCGWWGRNILREAIASGRCTIAALADADANILEIAGDQVNDLCGDTPKLYRDFRELCEKEKPDIAIVATPDHWHALNTIAALRAGAHVYLEKPTGHTINESKAIVAAARECGRVVQVGLHRRVGPHHVSAMKFLKSGAVGNVGMVRLFAHSAGTGPETPSPNEPAPDSMDWEMWCGPAPRRPFTKKLHPGGWRNFLDYANGTLGDWGVHWLDHVLWWSGEPGPKRVFCSGGRPVLGTPVLNEREQTTDAPDHQAAIYEFEKFTCVWEHRRFAGNESEKHRIGAYFYGTNGVLHIGWRDGWTFHPSAKGGKTEHEDAQLQEPDGHNIKLLWENFMAAIERRQPAAAGIELAHRATVLPLLGMISWRAGRSLVWDAEKEQIAGDDEAAKLMSRPCRAPWSYPA